MTNPAPQPPPTTLDAYAKAAEVTARTTERTKGKVQWTDPDYNVAFWAEVIRRLEDYEVDPEAADGQGPFYEIEVDYSQGVMDPAVITAIERKIVPQHSLSYLPYELPSYQAQPLTLDQWLKLSNLCSRYKVPFDPSDYRVYAPDASMMKGFAEGWVGGRFGSGQDGSRTTLYVGVAPDGRSHS